jgi:uncharacterized membrane-anchored protein
MRAIIVALATILAIASTAAVLAQPQTQSQEDREQAIRRAVRELKPQTGPITLANGIARIDASTMSYLSPADTEKLFVDIWGNPRSATEGNLGTLIPAGFDPLTDESWAIILSYSNDGHVSDSDASQIDYTDLLKSMQKSTADEAEERRKQGASGLQLVGWARPPFYDQTSHKLHWAMQLRNDRGQDSLNYNVRVLGREGVLVMNFVAAMENLPDIEKAIPGVMRNVNFTDGNRYDQFNASTDKLAEYGIAALVAGVALKKVGFFAVIIGVILAAKKFLIFGAIALFAGVGAFFKRARRGSRLPPPTNPPQT